MPVKIRKSKARDHRITEEAVAAFIARDYQALHHALGLPPWEESPLYADRTYVPSGPLDPTSWLYSVRQAQQLRRELEAAAKAARRAKRLARRRRSELDEAKPPAPAEPAAATD